MKIVIGITRFPEEIATLVAQYHGDAGTAVEVGPFLSLKEALNWLDSLKRKIGDLQEIPREQSLEDEAVYFGFTFEHAG